MIHLDPAGCDPAPFGPGLAKAIYNYMHGVGLETGVRRWFDFPTPKPNVPADLIAQALASLRPPEKIWSGGWFGSGGHRSSGRSGPRKGPGRFP
ncbi:MAG: hypothetical protein MPW14_13465 [Candidatus Manganitrophus sp.]|nr:MAG: hypothetical protein MPW14_13465 [Candidatus Manganitrophus sp.]